MRALLVLMGLALASQLAPAAGDQPGRKGGGSNQPLQTSQCTEVPSQQLDGLIYQEVPQPGCFGDGRAPRSAAESGYKSGTLLGSSGYLRVSVGADKALVDFLRTVTSGTSGGARQPVPVADSYQLP